MIDDRLAQFVYIEITAAWCVYADWVLLCSAHLFELRDICVLCCVVSPVIVARAATKIMLYGTLKFPINGKFIIAVFIPV